MAVKLGPRDFVLLSAIARLGLLSTSQVLRLGFAGRECARNTANKRLRKLVRAAYLRVSRPGGLGRDMLFTLGAAGRAALTARGEETAAASPRLFGWPAHALAINDVRIALALACRAAEDVELVSFESDAELARAGWGQRFAKVPDAAMTIARGGEAHRFFCELDLGGETHRTFEARHLRRYAELGASPGSVIVIAPSRQRLTNLARTAMRSELEHVARFAEMGVFLSDPLGPVLFSANALTDDEVREGCALLAARPFS